MKSESAETKVKTEPGNNNTDTPHTHFQQKTEMIIHHFMARVYEISSTTHYSLKKIML